MSEYKRNPRSARRARKSLSRKALVVLSLMMVLVLAAVGGTVAWLTAKTGTITNTFTVGDIDIDLYEHLRNTDGSLKTGITDTDVTRSGIDDYKIIPGVDLNKDPTVVVKAGSEACWVFVKVEETAWPQVKEDDETTLKIAYAIDSAWTALDKEKYPGVYYIQQTDLSSSVNDAVYNVLANKKVTVSDTLTKKDADDLKNTSIALKFTAYAIQQATFATAEDAWLEVSK